MPQRTRLPRSVRQDPLDQRARAFVERFVGHADPLHAAVVVNDELVRECVASGALGGGVRPRLTDELAHLRRLAGGEERFVDFAMNARCGESAGARHLDTHGEIMRASRLGGAL